MKLKQKSVMILISSVTMAIVLLILAGITISSTIKSNGTIKSTYNEPITKVSYEVKEVKDYQLIVLIEVENKNGIEKIILEDIIIECGGKEKIHFDRTFKEGDIYKVKVKTAEKDEEETHSLKIELPPPPPPNVAAGEISHTARPLTYTWEELGEIAKVISDNDDKITKDVEEVKIKMNWKDYVLGIGDTATVNGKKVRILGFNHDDLTNQDAEGKYQNAYGEGATNTKAGISFEFVDALIAKTRIHSSASNANGWGACELRGTLNNTTINTLENKEQIKQVQKQYIKTYNVKSSVTISNDYLWLLSCSEIWMRANDLDGTEYASAITKEGERYKFYTVHLGNAEWRRPQKVTVKGSFYWWLRSPSWEKDEYVEIWHQGRAAGRRATDTESYTASDWRGPIAACPGFAI